MLQTVALSRNYWYVDVDATTKLLVDHVCLERLPDDDIGLMPIPGLVCRCWENISKVGNQVGKTSLCQYSKAQQQQCTQRCSHSNTTLTEFSWPLWNRMNVATRRHRHHHRRQCRYRLLMAVVKIKAQQTNRRSNEQHVVRLQTCCTKTNTRQHRHRHTHTLTQIHPNAKSHLPNLNLGEQQNFPHVLVLLLQQYHCEPWMDCRFWASLCLSFNVSHWGKSIKNINNNNYPNMMILAQVTSRDLSVAPRHHRLVRRWRRCRCCCHCPEYE